MSEVKKIATRESYGHALVELGKEHEEVVVLDADLAEATKTGIFKKEFPERHIDCGIAECNMMGIAAGLAATGKVPFASSFAMFAAPSRPAEPPNRWVISVDTKIRGATLTEIWLSDWMEDRTRLVPVLLY